MIGKNEAILRATVVLGYAILKAQLSNQTENVLKMLVVLKSLKSSLGGAYD